MTVSVQPERGQEPQQAPLPQALLRRLPLRQALPQAPLRVLRRWRLLVVPAPLALAQAPLLELVVGRPLHHL